MPTEEQLLRNGIWLLRGDWGGSNNHKRHGQRFITGILNRTVTRISFMLSKFTQLGGSTPAKVYYEIRDWSTKALIYQQYVMEWVDLPALPTWFEIILTTPQYLNQAEIWLGVYHQSDSINAGCYVGYQTTDVKANERNAGQYNDNVWYDGDGDATYIYTYAAIPVVTTLPATAVGVHQASLNGILTDDGGMACDCGFEWGETVAYGNTTPTQSRTTGLTFAQTIMGLEHNKTYHFRAFATNGAGTSYGVDQTFTTLSEAPTVTTLAATGVT